jgi:2'-5' RNA ligase
MPTRTFIALDLADEVADDLVAAQQELATVGAAVRWVERANLHLTLKFLGDVEDAELAEVCRAAEEVAAAAEPCDFAVRGLSAVPPAGHLRMVWAGVTEPTGRLTALQAALEDRAEAMGFKREDRAYRPHLTLGRVRSGRNVAELRRAVAALAEADYGQTYAHRLVVYGSRLTPEGPVYTALATAKIGR